MKKIAYSAFIVLIAVISSCHKGNAPGSGGTWTFHSNTYKSIFTSDILNTLTGSTGTGTPSGTLTLYFNDTTHANIDTIEALYFRLTGRDTTIPYPASNFPPKNSSYIVTSTFPPDSGYVYVQVTDTSIANTWSPTGSMAPVVTVTRAANGFISATLPPVMVWNTNNSFTLFLNGGTPSNTIIGDTTHHDSTLVFGTLIQTN